MFAGVNAEPEHIEVDAAGNAVRGMPLVHATDALTLLRQARAVAATLIRPGHRPAPPALLMLADRLGFAPSGRRSRWTTTRGRLTTAPG